MNLQKLYNKLLKSRIIPPTRASSIKTSLKRYASALGYDDLVSCPKSAYLISPEERRRVIEDKSYRIRKGNSDDAELNVRTIVNTRSDVNFVLREAASLDLIQAKPKTSRQRPTAAAALHKYSPSHVEFSRDEGSHSPKVALSEAQLPTRLREELNKYYVWATSEFVLERPRRRKRRPVTANYDRAILKRIAGFHVTHCGAVLEDLSLQTLTDADAASKYINWFISHHRKVTITLKQILISLLCLSDYLMFTADSEAQRLDMAEASRRMRRVRDHLPDCVAVRDKEKCWLSLEQIELCAINRYPRNEARLDVASPAVRQKLLTLNTKGTGSNLKDTAIHAFESLLLRLMIRMPLRLRNFCEMSWNPIEPEKGKNLFRKNGEWHIRFSGTELKIESAKGKIKSVQHCVPPEITWLLEEVLTQWRPIITGIPYSLPENDEVKAEHYQESPQTHAPAYKRAPNNVLLFLNRFGAPANHRVIRHWVKSTTYAFAGIAVYPHLIRDIWATTFIKRTGDVASAAKRLGNTVEITMKHYAHLLDQEAEAKGDAFNRYVFGGEGEEN
jgi:hypothetical protein